MFFKIVSVFLATIDIFISSNYAGQECEICCSLVTDSNWVLYVRFLEIKNHDPEWGTLSVQPLAWHRTNTGRINACAFFLQCSTHAWARGRVSVLYGKNVCTSSVGSRKQCWVESCIWSVGTCAVNRPLSTSHCFTQFSSSGCPIFSLLNKLPLSSSLSHLSFQQVSRSHWLLRLICKEKKKR